MPRKVKSAKPLIYVFCEGESEQAYTDYLKKTFSDVAVLKRPPDTGLFEEAEAKFSKSPKYKNSIDVTDEIWFFYDVEEKDISKRILSGLSENISPKSSKMKKLTKGRCAILFLTTMRV